MTWSQWMKSLFLGRQMTWDRKAIGKKPVQYIYIFYQKAFRSVGAEGSGKNRDFNVYPDRQGSTMHYDMAKIEGKTRYSLQWNERNPYNLHIYIYEATFLCRRLCAGKFRSRSSTNDQTINNSTRMSNPNWPESSLMRCYKKGKC